MWRASCSFLVVFALLVATGDADYYNTFESPPITRECLKPGDCNPDECCVLGMQRYSVPHCARLGTPGDNCLVDNDPSDRLLEYPDRSILSTRGVYTLFCPCDFGLVCSRNSCSYQSHNGNGLFKR